MNSVYDDRFFLSIIPIPTHGLTVKVTDFEFSCCKFLTISKPFDRFSSYYGMMIDVGLKVSQYYPHLHPWPEGQGHGLRIFMLLVISKHFDGFSSYSTRYDDI